MLVRSLDGRFFDVDEEKLKAHEVKTEEGAPPGGLPPPGQPYQIIINIPPVGGGPPPPADQQGEVSGRTNMPGPIYSGPNWMNWGNYYNPWSSAQIGK